MIYLDNAASTPLAPELKDKLEQHFASYGNHQSDQMIELQAGIEHAKSQICQYFSGDPKRLFFTSGATEAINLAIKGASHHYRHSGKHLITFATEHASVLKSHGALKQDGYDISVLPVLSNGSIDTAELEAAIRPDTIMVTINLVCNETGFIQDLSPLLKLREKHGFLIHADASQAIGKTQINIIDLPIDFISLSSHKSHGPAGIGALYIANNRHVTPLVSGNHPVRSGTLPHNLISLMGESYSLAKTRYQVDYKYVTALRQSFLHELSGIEYALNQSLESSTPHILNIAFNHATEQDIANIRKAIYCQQSASCHKSLLSHVLKARNIAHKQSAKSLRFSFSRLTSQNDILLATKHIVMVLSKN